jgi:hypothetical protein
VLLHAIRPALLGTPAPSPYRGADLLALTRRVAAQVGAGRHPYVIDPERRWYHRVGGDDTVDIWLITWATEQASELHDHAGSLGALTVVSGRLVEDRWSPTGGGLRRRTIRVGRGAAFGLGHVHEVSNPGPEPAVSVHAYSPPLTAMSYYALDPAAPGRQPRLRRTRTVLTEPGSPEGVG